jgi:hypothetical protein
LTGDWTVDFGSLHFSGRDKDIFSAARNLLRQGTWIISQLLVSHQKGVCGQKERENLISMLLIALPKSRIFSMRCTQTKEASQINTTFFLPQGGM